jgi:hypothetical protein
MPIAKNTIQPASRNSLGSRADGRVWDDSRALAAPPRVRTAAGGGVAATPSSSSKSGMADVELAARARLALEALIARDYSVRHGPVRPSPSEPPAKKTVAVSRCES